MIRERIEEALRAALPGVAFVVERPRSLEHGDYSTNAALVSKTDPHELAAKLTVEGVEKIEVVGKFINFFLTREELLPKQAALPQPNAGKLVLIEYTSPNLFKPLHVGNLVSNILGESVARLFEKTGARAVRINYPSDIGLTVAKAVWGLKQLGLNPADINDLGRAYVAGTEAYEGAAKQEIETINKALYENADPELSALRAKGVETSRKHLDELCARMGTTFDKEFFESETGPVGRELVRAHTGGVFEESEGAVVYRGEQEGLHTRVFLSSQGLPTYEAKDLGLLKCKLDAYPDFDITLTDTGPEQTEYFKVLYAAARKIFPQLKEKTLGHIAHGYLKLTTGKMSSRRGNVITGESLLEDLNEASKEKMRGREVGDANKVAEQVAVGAVKYAVLKQGSGRDIMFDPEKSLSLEGDSGPYLQYAHTRAQSLLREVKKAGIEPDASDAPGQASKLERLLVHYADAFARSAREMEPHYLTTFLTELAGEFNSWYAHNRVIGGTAPCHGALLTQVVAHTLREGLEALGIPVPEEM